MNARQKLKIALTGGKKNYIRLRINRQDKSTTHLYVHTKNITDGKFIQSDKRAWIIKKDFVYEENGFRTLTYNEGNYEPLDYVNYNPKNHISDTELYAGLNEKVTEHIIAASMVDYDLLKKLLIVGIAVSLAGLGGIYFVLSGQITELQEQIAEQNQLIRDLGNAIGGARP